MKCPNCEHVGRYLFCSNCGERFPYNEFDELLIKYFYKGYYYDEILQFLSHHHGTEVCMRTLKSHLGRLNLNRKNFSQRDFAEAFAAISREIDFCCDAVGYRTIWHRLSVKYGFPIHGCCDGFSRKILWLRVINSNNNPKIICNLFLKTVEEIGVFPRCVRSDCGTENGYLAAAQCYFNRQSDHRAHLYGSSNHNQRIESWWSQFRRLNTEYLINFFQDMVDEGIYNTGDYLHRACAFYCFAPLIQHELDSCMEQWNSHFIRHSPNVEASGRPDVLYSFPPNGFRENCTQCNPADIATVRGYSVNLENDMDQNNFDWNSVDFFNYLCDFLILPEFSNLQIAKQNFIRMLPHCVL
ncbi:uncharacterized protein [Clytia hemisphaerica]|uniref:uncharacterized protein n=1 Tax=Clytia hemisphaerica TaxID=252671 RepID=UPI0034D4D632